MRKRAGLRYIVASIIFIGILVVSTGTVFGYSTGDDYPYRGQGDGIDPWNFYKGQCTSFVAWCLNSRNGVKFTNQYGGVSRWGNAKEWGGVAESLGIEVDMNPAVGSIAWHNRNTYGHVAWVKEVSGNKVTVEEYNHVAADTFGTRTIDKSTFTGFIHIKDIEPSPDIIAKSISLNKSEITKIAGDIQNLTATLTPSDTTDKSLTWTSSDTTVATVTSTGTGKAKVVTKKAGTATITAKTSNGKTAKCTVTVKAATALNLTNSRLIFDGTYMIKNADNDFAVCVQGNSLENGGNVHMWTYKTSNKFQQWKFTHRGSGYYSIENIGSDKALEVAGGSTEARANVQQNEYNGTDRQLWQPVPTGTGAYYLVPKCAKNRVLHIHGTIQEEADLETMACDGASKNQRFVFVPNPNTAVTGITLSETSKAKIAGDILGLTATLAPAGATCDTITWTSSDTSIATVARNTSNPAKATVTTKKAGKVTITAAAGGKSATCILTVKAATAIPLTNTAQIPNGTYIIKKADAAFSVCVQGNSNSAGGNVHMWTFNKNSDYQKWKFTHQGGGYYSVINVGSGMALEVEGGSSVSRTNVQQNTPNSSSAQLWQPAKNADGTFYLVPKCAANRVLHVDGNKNENAAELETMACDGTSAAQRFVFYAEGRTNTLTMRYNANGGTVGNTAGGFSASSSGTVQKNGSDVLTKAGYGDTQVLSEYGLWNASSFGLTKTGYHFKGWSLSKDGSTTVFGEDDTTLRAETIYPNVKNWDAEVTLYAVWESCSLTLNTTSLTRVVGETYSLTATVTPVTLPDKDKTVTWKSSDTSIVSIESNGKLRALKAGTATVTATTADGGTSASCTVTVTDADDLVLSTSRTIRDGIYKIRMSGTSYVFAVEEKTDEKGGNICIMQENETDPYQQFRFEYVSDGYYTVTNVGSGMCLDDYGLGTEPGTNIDQWAPNGSASQLWQPVQNGNVYYLTPKCAPNLVADVEYGVKAEGTNVSLWIPKGGTHQLFELIPVKTEMDEPDFVLPAGLTTIKEEAFAGLSMTVVRCPETLQEIGPRAFADCENLKEIYIPASTVTIAEDAFAGCGELTIWGKAGSVAEQFADGQGILFEVVSE